MELEGLELEEALFSPGDSLGSRLPFSIKKGVKSSTDILHFGSFGIESLSKPTPYHSLLAWKVGIPRRARKHDPKICYVT
jgi:hypothetical protein